MLFVRIDCRVVSFAALAIAIGCKDPKPRSDAGTTRAIADASEADAAPASNVVDASVMPVLDASPTIPAVLPKGQCRLLYGPEEQSFRGPATLRMRTDSLELVQNESGRPRILSLPITPVAHARPGAIPTSFHPVRWPPCAIAGANAYCTAPGGSILLSRLGPEPSTKEIGKAQASARIAAATIGTDHSVVAYLGSKPTAEGPISVAYGILDTQEPVRLSEEGGGATAVDLVSVGDKALLLYLDGRAAMTPIHARELSVNGDKLVLGKDAVVYVAGSAVPGMEGRLVVPRSGDPFALLPMSEGAVKFGLGSIKLASPLKEDIPATFSPYANGMSLAPVAAIADGDAIYVLRVVPSSPEKGAPKRLELGKLDQGVFMLLQAVAEGKPMDELSLSIDKFGAVWMMYGDAKATYLERRHCPSARSLSPAQPSPSSRK